MEAGEELQRDTIYQHAVKQGAILGAIQIVITVIFYLVSLSVMGSFKFILLIFASYIGYTIYAGIDYRKSIGGFIAYGQAFIHGITMMATASAFGLAFGLVLYNLIDTNLASNLTEAILSNTEETMRNWGAPEERIESQLAQMREDIPNGFTPLGMVKNYLLGLIWYGCFALITSLVVRKTAPVAM